MPLQVESIFIFGNSVILLFRYSVFRVSQRSPVFNRIGLVIQSGEVMRAWRSDQRLVTISVSLLGVVGKTGSYCGGHYTYRMHWRGRASIL